VSAAVNARERKHIRFISLSSWIPQSLVRGEVLQFRRPEL
jgi:hypothetical protein